MLLKLLEQLCGAVFLKRQKNYYAGAIKQHETHVQRFLTEMYQTMVDPLDDFKGNIAELCEVLLKQAREDREALNARAEALTQSRDWRSMGIVELAVENQSVSDYITHWEGRTLTAEAELAKLRTQSERPHKLNAVKMGLEIAGLLESFWDKSCGENAIDSPEEAMKDVVKLAQVIRKRVSEAQSTDENFIAEVRDPEPYPSCHVCGAEMVPDGYKCLSCKATTKPTGEAQSETALVGEVNGCSPSNKEKV